MSGFFGIVRQDGKPVSPKLLDAVAEKMSFRGPDDHNVWSHENLGSCFALMRTGPTKQAAQQPVTWCNRLWLWGMYGWTRERSFAQNSPGLRRSMKQVSPAKNCFCELGRNGEQVRSNG